MFCSCPPMTRTAKRQLMDGKRRGAAGGGIGGERWFSYYTYYMAHFAFTTAHTCKARAPQPVRVVPVPFFVSPDGGVCRGRRRRGLFGFSTCSQPFVSPALPFARVHNAPRFFRERREREREQIASPLLFLCARTHTRSTPK